MFDQLGVGKVSKDFEIQIASARSVFLNTDNYFLEIFDFNSPALVVTFEAAGAPISRPDGYRPGWGVRHLRRLGISSLCVKPKQVDWYRKPDLAAAFSLLREQGFFSKFETVMTYGGSMGGFAALAYADAVEARIVLSINPQSTLNRDKVPWENRFKIGMNQDWTSSFSDAADGFRSVKKAYVVVDRMYKKDWGHVVRLPQERRVSGLLCMADWVHAF